MAHKDVANGLTRKILIGMGLGAMVGYFFHSFGADQSGIDLSGANAFFIDNLFELGGALFVSSLKMLVVPLVFVSLVCGVCAIGSGSRIGAISLKTLAFYMTTTALAVALALTISNIIDPGLSSVTADDIISDFTATKGPGILEVLKDLIPKNIVAAMAQDKMLQIIVFAILFGFALSKQGQGADLVKKFFGQLDKVIMTLVLLLMRIAPIGVFCLIAKLFADSGLENVGKLGAYFLNVIVVLLLHMFITYGLLLWGLTGLNPLVFYKKMQQLWLFGFSTASSNASIPITLDTVEHKLGVHNEVASFTVPLGATINMDGTAIMQGVATVFIAQYYGIEIGLAGYLMVVLTATLASIGTAGVPGVGLITLALVLEQVGLPVEGIALIIGVDRILDMLRTAVNITGDSVASIVVAKSEKMLDIDTFYKQS
jgi:Na+/H+-dicarboxylate symporter